MRERATRRERRGRDDCARDGDRAGGEAKGDDDERRDTYDSGSFKDTRFDVRVRVKAARWRRGGTIEDG